MISRVRLFLALATALIVWLPVAGLAQRSQVSQEDLKRWLTYIASDELQGREVFTEGFGLAGAYIAEQLRTWRVEPAGDSGSYFQTVTVRGMRTRSNSSVTVTRNGETRTFKDGEGVTFPRNQGGRQTISAPLEFVGYGLQFPLLNHDDYAGRDMKGKIALFIGRGVGGMTAAHTRLINGRARDAIELEHAAAAIGPVIPIPGRGATPAADSPDAGRGGAPAPPPVAPPGNAAQRVDFQTTRDLSLPVPPQITASDDFFAFVFAGSGYSYEDLKALTARQEPLPAISLRDVTITITIDADYDGVQTRLTRNVVGVVRGSDARLKDTFVGLGAHYDHVGYQQFAPTGRGTNLVAACAGQTRPTPRPGDIISNGADDNGSGTVALMALAKAFATGPKPRRSLLFIWHTGEEAGLQGSRFMADHPVLPLERMVAMLNMDMVGRNRCDSADESNKVYLVGSERISTELHNINEDANASLRRPLTLDYEYNDVSDLESIYTRSDHYSYAAKGVPIIFFTTGLHRDYHFRTDEVDKIEFDKMARITELIYATAARVANLDHAPVRDHAGPRVGKGQTGPIR